MTVSANKKQLIDLIRHDLISNKESLKGKLVITGSNPIPVEINSGVIVRREDMNITHVEADTMLIHHIIYANVANVLVVADDTDVFILFCLFVFDGSIASSVKMVSPIKGRSMIDINESVEQNKSVMKNLLAAHAIAGCDTVATYHGIGKNVALKMLQSHEINLDAVRDMNSALSDVMGQSVKYLLYCSTEVRIKVWKQKAVR